MSSPTPFHSLLEKFAADVERLRADTARIWADAERGKAEACAQVRREVASQLNQAVRLMRQSATREDLGDTTANKAAAFASGAVWLRIEDGTAHSEKLDLTIPLSSAAALAGAVQTREPVIALATATEVSPQLVDRFAHTPESRAFIHPIVAEEKTPALLYAWADGAAKVENSALELLAQTASGVWEALKPPPPPPEPLVTIAPAAPATKPWEALSAGEQQVHLRAQRYARVQVSEMRLRHNADVQAGRARRSLYEILREPIDTARTSFRNQFFAICPSMLDYLHLELTRTLANDDADLLGKDYPGPMV